MSKFKEVSMLLNQMGIRSNILGYNYLRTGILFILEDDEIIPKSKITKEIYPKIAKEYDSTPSRVERAIRHAIGLVSPFNQLRKDIFPYVIGDKINITNKEFMYGVANYLALNNLEEEEKGA